MKILLLGKDGQVGWELQRALAPLGELIACNRHEADLEQSETLRQLVRNTMPQIVVNAAAYTAVDRAESEPDAAYAINRDGAGIVAEEATRRGLPVIHVSTDSVFSGDKRAPYLETDPPAPLSAYGRSKLAGEERVLACHRSCVVRTAWLFSAQGKSFVRTILGLALDREELRIVHDQTGSPTAAPDLAATLVAMAPRLLDGEGYGLFHCAGDEPATWFELASAAIAEAESQGAKVARLTPITTQDYPLPAPRAAYAVLDSTLIRRTHATPRLSWRSSLPRIVARLLEARIT